MGFTGEETIDSAEFKKRLGGIGRSKFYSLLPALKEGVDFVHPGNEYYFFWSKKLLLKLTKIKIDRSKPLHAEENVSAEMMDY